MVENTSWAKRNKGQIKGQQFISIVNKKFNLISNQNHKF